MSKLDDNGKSIYNESRRVMRGPNYFKPNLIKFIKKSDITFLNEKKIISYGVKWINRI